MEDPVARNLANAPCDDESVTEDDRHRFHEGQAWFRHPDGKGISMEDMLAGFDLKLEDFRPHPDGASPTS